MQVQLWMMAVLLAADGATATDAVRIDAEPQLFVDDALVGSKAGVVRTVHPCRKLPRPVLEPERPWEGERVYVYGSVHYDPAARRFILWYMSNPVSGTRGDGLERGRGAMVLYATSEDGIHWVRPNLGLYAFDGSKENNIVYGLDSPSILVNAHESNPDQRYKMIGYAREAGKTGAWAAHSADGVHWKDYPVNPLFKTGDTLTVTRDPRSGDYLAFHKINAEHRGYSRRMVGLTVSKDLQTWSDSKLVMVPDEKDDAWASRPDQRTEFYDMSAFPYGGQFLGLVAVFRKMQRLEKALPHQSRDDGPIHAELVHSRDGRTWRRLEERVPVIPNGPSDFDAGCILGMTNTPVVVGDEVWVYYTGITTTHGGAMPAKRITIGRAAWRLDGFVSLDAGREGGVVETVPLRPAGKRLSVNAVATGGSLAVEVLDETGRPLADYAAADCVEIRGDSVRQVVRWRDRDTLDTSRPIRLRFQLKGCKLFSFTMR